MDHPGIESTGPRVGDLPPTAIPSSTTPTQPAGGVGPGIARHPGATREAHPGFLADRLAERWDHGQPIRDSDDVSRLIARFSPDEVPAQVWARIEGPVRAWVQQAEPHTLERARNLMNATAQLAIWAETIGLPLEPDVILRPETIDRFVVEGCEDLSDGTKTNYRTALRAVGRKVLGPGLFPPQPVSLSKSPKEPPYSQGEVAALVAWARGVPTERMRENAMTLLAFGLGAGLTTQEIARVIGTDVIPDDDDDGVLVAVTGKVTRSVPVLRRWEEEVLFRSAEVGGQPVFLPHRTQILRNAIPNFIWRCQHAHPGPHLSIQRLRITWIVNQLQSGTSVQDLAPYAGVKAEHLCGYFEFIEPHASGAVRRAIREAGCR